MEPIEESASRRMGSKPPYRKPKGVLIIDDDPLARKLLRLLFESEGYHCQEAENGALGLAILDQYQPDLVVTDHNMPVLTGLEFLAGVSRENQRKVPAVIVVTGSLSQELKTRALQSGARAVLEKPFDIEEIRTLANWLLDSDESLSVGQCTVN